MKQYGTLPPKNPPKNRITSPCLTPPPLSQARPFCPSGDPLPPCYTPTTAVLPVPSGVLSLSPQSHPTQPNRPANYSSPSGYRLITIWLLAQLHLVQKPHSVCSKHLPRRCQIYFWGAGCASVRRDEPLPPIPPPYQPPLNVCNTFNIAQSMYE